jgi:RimJ/RimL family protein N-acetyltransferase
MDPRARGAVPVLLTARCELRPVSAGDAAELHALWTAPGVRRFLWDDEIIPLEQTADAIRTSEALFRDHRFGLWAARLQGEAPIAGFAGLWPFRDPPEFELLYGVAEAHWGRGLAVEASRAVLDYCRDALSMTRLRASTDAGNTASVRVLDRLGFTPVRRAVAGGLDTLFYERVG